MSNTWYDKLLTRVGKGLLNLNTLTNPKIIAVETDLYDFSQVHEYLDDIPLSSRLATASMVNTRFGTEVGGVDPAPTGPTDYVAKWTMDNADITAPTIFDSTGNNHDATMVNTPTTGEVGQKGEAVLFELANSEYATLVNHADLRPAELTVSGWVKLETVAANGYILSSYNSTSGTFIKSGMSFYVQSAGVLGFVWAENTSSSVNFLLGETRVDDGVYHQVTATFTGTSVRLYVDGVLDAVIDGSHTLAYDITTNKARIGAIETDAQGVLNHFDGTIDDLKLFNRALTAQEVQDTFLEDGGRLREVHDYVARWELESNTTAPDSTWRGHDGTINGTPVAASAGVIGNALTFDGVDDYISIVNHVDLRPVQFSACAWIKTSTVSGQVIQSYNADGSTVNGGFQINVTATGKIKLWVSDGIGNVYLTNFIDCESTSTVTDDIWNFIVATFDELNLKIYINGVLENTVSWTAIGYMVTNFVNIGSLNRDAGLSSFFNGQIDDPRLYNRAITQAEVSTIFNSRIVAPPEDFVAEWLMDDDVLETLGNHDATAVGTPIYEQGIEGNALVLNGVDQYATVVDHADLRPASLTIVAWIKTSTPSGTMFQSSNDKDSGSGGAKSGFYFNVTALGQTSLVIHDGVWETVGVNWDRALSTTFVNDGRWHCIVGTYDGSEIKIYVDGLLEDTTTWSLLLYLPINFVQIGMIQDDGGNANFFNGSIDKLQLFNRAVTADEVVAMAMYTPQGSGGPYGSVEAWLTADNPTFSQPAPLAPTDYLAYFTMDDADISAPTINDVSGSTNTHNATMIDTPTTGEVGQIGEAILFNGTTEYATLVNHADLNASNFSISGWVKLATVSADNDIFDNYNENTGATLIAGFRCYITSTGKLALLVGKNTGLVSGTDYETAISTSSVDDGTWRYITVTYDGADIKVYVDGDFEIETAWVGVDFTGALTRIAARSTDAITADKFFDGTIDDLKFYDRALSADEIARIFDPAVDQATVKSLIIYEDTGVEASSPLLLHIDEATILPKITESGKDLEVLWQGKGIARL